MPSLASIIAEPNQGLVVENPVTLQRDPVSAEGAIARLVLDGPPLLVSLLKRTVGEYESEIQL